MSDKVPIVSAIELLAMHTGTLMARRTALLACEESFELSDRSGSERPPKAAQTGYIEFKNTPEWQQAYGALKEILADRENVPGKAERKIARQKKAQSRS